MTCGGLAGRVQPGSQFQACWRLPMRPGSLAVSGPRTRRGAPGGTSAKFQGQGRAALS